MPETSAHIPKNIAGPKNPSFIILMGRMSYHIATTTPIAIVNTIANINALTSIELFFRKFKNQLIQRLLLAGFSHLQFIDSDYSSKQGLMHNRSNHKVKVTSAIASSTGGNCVRLARVNIQPTTNGQSKNMKEIYLKVRLAKRFGHPKENMMKPVPNRIPSPRTALIISQAGINGSP